MYKFVNNFFYRIGKNFNFAKLHSAALLSIPSSLGHVINTWFGDRSVRRSYDDLDVAAGFVSIKVVVASVVSTCTTSLAVNGRHSTELPQPFNGVAAALVGSSIYLLAGELLLAILSLTDKYCVHLWAWMNCQVQSSPHRSTCCRTDGWRPSGQ